MSKNRRYFFSLVSHLAVGFLIFQQLFLLSALNPPETHTLTLTNASATLSNPRLSYYAKVSGAHTAADMTILIQGSSNADNNTNHLFPQDSIAVGPNGSFTVGSIIDSTNFALTAPLTVGASDGDAVYATQSGSLTIVSTLASNIPASGYIKVTIPDPASGGNDKAPDTAASVAANGFDLNGMAITDVTTSGGTGCTWSGTETLTAGSGSGHTYKQVTTTQCTGGEITLTFDSAPGLINPAPVTSGHTQGAADEYTLTVATYNSSDQLIDSVDVMVAPVEGVLVSATVDESLSFSVAGVASSASVCGITTDVTTYAYSIPWGTIAANTFKNAAQLLTVSTNSDDGYVVRLFQDSLMSINGLSVLTIPDTTCDSGPCTHTTQQNWNTATNNGFGYSLANSSGTDAKFLYNGTGTFDSKQIPTAWAEGDDTDAELMTNAAPVSGSAAHVCYRLSVSGTQTAGYYVNKLSYNAIPTF